MSYTSVFFPVVGKKCPYALPKSLSCKKQDIVGIPEKKNFRRRGQSSSEPIRSSFILPPHSFQCARFKNVTEFCFLIF